MPLLKSWRVERGTGMNGNGVVAAILGCAIAVLAWGQKSVSPEPHRNPRELAAAMQLIEQELSGIGRLEFTVHVADKEEGNGTSRYIEEIGKVVADPASCTIRYHRWRSMHGEVVNDEDIALKLHEVVGVWAMSSSFTTSPCIDLQR